MKQGDITLSERYARAYMAPEMAASHKEMLAHLEEALKAVAPFSRFLLHPVISFEQKSEILTQVLAGPLAGTRAARLVALMAREGRLGLADRVLDQARLLHERAAGQLRARVTTRFGLSDEELREIEKKLSAAVGRKVLARQETSEAVLGGVEIVIGDLLVDATVKGRLAALRRKLSAQG